MRVFLNHDTDRLDVTLAAPASTQTQAQDHHAQAIGQGAGRQTPAGASSHTTTRAEVIHTTANHPWLTADHGWLLAGALRVGEPVRLLDGATATVEALHALPGVGPMWDLSLDAIHTFAVGDAQAVVHNCGGTETTTSRDLYRGGNASSPRIDNVRVGKDVFLDANGNIGPVGPNGEVQGMSTFESPQGEKNWWRLPAGTELPDGLQAVNDHGTHWTIQPSREMSVEDFRSLLQNILGWEKV